MASSRDINNTNISWRCRQPISELFQISHSLNVVYHISRNTNGIAHNCAHQVLNSRVEPVFSCSRSSHGNVPFPFLQSLLNFQVQGYVIHAVHCLWVEWNCGAWWSLPCVKKTSNILAYFLHSFLQEDMARYRIDLAHNLLIHRMNNALKERAFNEELVALFFGRFKTDKLLSSLV